MRSSRFCHIDWPSFGSFVHRPFLCVFSQTCFPHFFRQGEPMAKDFSTMEDSNRSSNPSIHEVSDPSRRTILRGGLGATLSSLLAPLGAASLTACASMGGGPLLGFKAVGISTADKITVPEGYIAEVIAAWGEPVGVPGNMPAWREDASQSATEAADASARKASARCGSGHSRPEPQPAWDARPRALRQANASADRRATHPSRT